VQDWELLPKSPISQVFRSEFAPGRKLTIHHIITQPSSIVESGSNHQIDSWLCPITSNPQQRGILNIPESQYFDLVDRSGRILCQGKRGSITPDLAPILSRIGAKPDAWIDTISRFGSKFRLAAGSPNNLRSFSKRIGVHWLFGASAARASFL
jgi:hypothetical protein